MPEFVALLASQPYSGTHSVIDMTRVSDEPESQAVGPAPEWHLREVFGTVEPTPEAIEAAITDDLLDDYGRWHGMYLVGYCDGVPVEIFFVGRSGD